MALLRKTAIGMLDQEDGRATDWPVVAQMLFRAAFSAIDEAPGEERALSVLRRVAEGIYRRLAGNPEDDLPPALKHVAGVTPQPGVLARTPRPKLKP